MKDVEFNTWILLVIAVSNLLTPFFWLWMKKKFNSMSGTIDLLEKNTNSIKDALVKTTGEAEKAKGVLEGRAQIFAAEKPRL